MRMCSKHWEMLSKAIQSRRLWHLVSQSGPELTQKVMDDVFDPLMYAHNAIVYNAVQNGGLSVFADNDDGSPRCPVCYGMSFNSEWEGCVEKAADDALERAKKLNLVMTS